MPSECRAAGIIARLMTTGRDHLSNADTLTMAAIDGGVPTYQVSTWYGLWAPKGTPKDLIDRMTAEVTKALNSPELKEKLLSMGMEPIALDPAQSASYMKTEIDRWANVVKISGAKID